MSPNTAPRIVLIGTLDTKGAEIEYVRRRINELGAVAVVIDSGILGEALGCKPDVSRSEVASSAGHSIDDVRQAGSRGRAVEMMREGVRAVCLRLYQQGGLQGAISFGGAEGALLGAFAMHSLPLVVRIWTPRVWPVRGCKRCRRYAFGRRYPRFEPDLGRRV